MQRIPMDAYNYLKEEILKINQDILALISKAKSMSGMAETSFGDWEKTCRGLPDQMKPLAFTSPLQGSHHILTSSVLQYLFGEAMWNN